MARWLFPFDVRRRVDFEGLAHICAGTDSPTFAPALIRPGLPRDGLTDWLRLLYCNQSWPRYKRTRTCSLAPCASALRGIAENFRAARAATLPRALCSTQRRLLHRAARSAACCRGRGAPRPHRSGRAARAACVGRLRCGRSILPRMESCQRGVADTTTGDHRRRYVNIPNITARTE